MYASDSLATQESKCSHACCTFAKHWYGNKCENPFNKPGGDSDGKKEAKKYATTQIASDAAKKAGLLGVTWSSKERSTI